jgi:hypothetical protein
MEIIQPPVPGSSGSATTLPHSIRCGRHPLSPILSRAPQRNYRGICQPVGVSRDLPITATTDGGVEPTYWSTRSRLASGSPAVSI